MEQTHLAGGANVGPREARRADGPVFSIGCIVVASAIVLLVLVVFLAVTGPWASSSDTSRAGLEMPEEKERLLGAPGGYPDGG